MGVFNMEEHHTFVSMRNICDGWSINTSRAPSLPPCFISSHLKVEFLYLHVSWSASCRFSRQYGVLCWVWGLTGVVMCVTWYFWGEKGRRGESPKQVLVTTYVTIVAINSCFLIILPFSCLFKLRRQKSSLNFTILSENYCWLLHWRLSPMNKLYLKKSSLYQQWHVILNQLICCTSDRSWI